MAYARGTKRTVAYQEGSKVRRLKLPPYKPTYFEVSSEYEDRKKAMADPKTLIVINEVIG